MPLLSESPFPLPQIIEYKYTKTEYYASPTTTQKGDAHADAAANACASTLPLPPPSRVHVLRRLARVPFLQGDDIAGRFRKRITVGEWRSAGCDAGGVQR